MGEVLEARRLLSRPTIVSAAFDYETSPHKYVVTFDQNVAASLSAADLRVEAVTSTDQNPVASSLSYDGGTNTATFTFAGVLPEANYRAVLSSEDVANGAGEPLASDHVDDFFFLVADASGPDGVPDRLVGVADQDRISANFGGSNKTFSQGDYNYDTIVNMADFNLLANKFGAEMPPPPDGPGVTMVRAVTSSSLEPNWIDNVTGEAGWRVQWSFDGQNFSNYVNLDADSTFWPHTGLPDNTRVWYRTRAYGNGQDTAYTPKVAANTLLPAPGKASVTELDDGRYEITFPDNSVNESGFVVEVTDPAGGPTQTYTVPPNGDGEASIVLDEIEQSGQYEVLVRATGLQDSATSLSDRYTRTIAAPRKLELRATGPNTVSLRWRDRSNNEVGFRVERMHGGAFIQVGQVSFNNERWTNYGVLAGTTHSFRVRAYGALGFSPYSEPKFVTTPSQHMPGEPDFPSEPPAPQGQVGSWQTHGGDVSIDQALNRISLGATNLSETDRPYSHLRSASYPLGQNPPATITFDYDLSTFDGASWDTFGVSITDVPYHQITYGSTLPTLAFAWGGVTDRGLETQTGTATIDVPPNSTGKWLIFTLGANRFSGGFFLSSQPQLGMRDNWYPSWGTFTILSADIDGLDAISGDEVAEDVEDSTGVLALEPGASTPSKLVIRSPFGSFGRQVTFFGATDKIRIDGAAVPNNPIMYLAADPTQKQLEVTATPEFVAGTEVFAKLEVLNEQSQVVSTDSIKIVPIKAEVLIGADSASDRSTHDDWVGASGHKIVNFLKLTAAPNTQYTIALERLTQGTGSVTLDLETFSLTADGAGRAEKQFVITGGTASDSTENVKITARVNDRPVGWETLTVLDMKFFDETSGKSPIPVNPAVVTPAAVVHGGNLFGISRSQDTDAPDFVSIDLQASPKINPEVIEVLWGRSNVDGVFKDSSEDPSLVIAPQHAALESELRTPLRMRDQATSFGSGTGSIHYFIGHPTSRTSPTLKLNGNYAATIESYAGVTLTFPVFVHLMSGPTLSSGLNGSQVGARIADVNAIWSQVGISFRIVGLASDAVGDNLLNVHYTGSGLLSGEQGAVTDVNERQDAIDMYFVNKVFEDAAETTEANAGTVLVDAFGVLNQANPGIIVGANSVDYSADPTTKARQLSRTIAHELLHFMMNKGDEAHTGQPQWNLMRTGASDRKREITAAQFDVIRLFGLAPNGIGI